MSRPWVFVIIGKGVDTQQGDWGSSVPVSVSTTTIHPHLTSSSTPHYTVPGHQRASALCSARSD